MRRTVKTLFNILSNEQMMKNSYSNKQTICNKLRIQKNLDQIPKTFTDLKIILKIYDLT